MTGLPEKKLIRPLLEFELVEDQMRKKARLETYVGVRKMVISIERKKDLKRELVERLQMAPEISKIIIFGSFLVDDAPNDIDVAIVQNSNLSYLALAMKYRKLTRSVARQLPLDIIPLKTGAIDSSILDAIAQGEVIYER